MVSTYFDQGIEDAFERLKSEGALRFYGFYRCSKEEKESYMESKGFYEAYLKESTNPNTRLK